MPVDLHRMAGGERGRELGGTRRLDGDHGRLGLSAGHRHADPGQEPATADRHQEGVHARPLLEHFEPAGALARDHVGVLVGGNQRQSPLGRQIAAALARGPPSSRRRRPRRPPAARPPTLICGAIAASPPPRVIPSRRAAQATAWPWLPLEWVTTPRARPPRESRRIAVEAPRTLKAPIGCRCSHFSAHRVPRQPRQRRGLDQGRPHSHALDGPGGAADILERDAGRADAATVRVIGST